MPKEEQPEAPKDAFHGEEDCGKRRTRQAAMKGKRGFSDFA